MYFNSSPYTAISDFSYPVMNMVTFAAGNIVASVDVPIIDDSNVEPTEIFSVTLSATQPHVVIGDGTATITILDDDG